MARFDLTYWENAPNNYAIPQGGYYSFMIHYPVLDLTSWALRGQIRRSFNNTEILTAFNFKPTIYGPLPDRVGNYSTITVFLNASQTAGLPTTKPRTSKTDTIQEGLNVFVYDIEAVDPDNSENVLKLITKSWIEIEGEVTR